MSRFVVREVSGSRNASTGGGYKPGLNVVVLDSAYCYRIVGSWQSERYRCSRLEARLRARREARAFADRLNAARDKACPW